MKDESYQLDCNKDNSNTTRTGVLIHGDMTLDFDNYTVNDVHIDLMIDTIVDDYFNDDDLFDLCIEMYEILHPKEAEEEEEKEDMEPNEDNEIALSEPFTPKCSVTQALTDQCVFPEPVTALELNMLLASFGSYDGDYDALLEEYEKSKKKKNNIINLIVLQVNYIKSNSLV